MTVTHLSAADHFARAEDLLTLSGHGTSSPEVADRQARRAQVHMDAARFLLDLQLARHRGDGDKALRHAGLYDLAKEREVS